MAFLKYVPANATAGGSKLVRIRIELDFYIYCLFVMSSRYSSDVHFLCHRQT